MSSGGTAPGRANTHAELIVAARKIPRHSRKVRARLRLAIDDERPKRRASVATSKRSTIRRHATAGMRVALASHVPSHCRERTPGNAQRDAVELVRHKISLHPVPFRACGYGFERAGLEMTYAD